ncbi:tetratricopeptide repeat-containing sensor histidine kinase [Oleiharenicola lentus]|uniref:sensor histidine kinase n=1 Tax=Oleiharenicola lentus TaxID=2508720 RepID=UPI003F66C294
MKLAPAESRPISAEIRARTQLAEALRMTSNYPEARTVIDAALALPAGDAEKLERAQALHGSGQIYWNRGDYARAEACFVEAQTVAEVVADKRLLTRVLNSRGIVARHQKNLTQSADFFTKALIAAGDEIDLRLQIQNNLAVLYIDMGRLDDARTQLTANLATHTANNNRRSVANAIINLAIVETNAGNHIAALDYNLRALALRKELGIPRHIASAQVAVAASLIKAARADEALSYLKNAQIAAEKLASHELWANLYTAMSNAHAAREEFREALDFQKKAEKENELVAGEKTAAAVAELRERFDAEKRERELVEMRASQLQKNNELALKESELQRHKLERYAFGVVLILSSITFIAIVGRHRAKVRAERIIFEQTQRAREAAEEANQTKTRLLDLASHDLKAPLVGVMMTADILIEESANQANLIEPARSIRAESERMFKLVQGLLDGSAVEANRLKLTLASLDLNSLVAATISVFQRRAAHKQQRVEFTPAKELPEIEGDYTRLQQVVENLIDNALKFSPAGTTVHIAVSSQMDRVQLAVRDEGPGLTDEDKQKLFQKFSRLSAVPTAGETSTGLGLALARELVELHGGKIWAESKPSEGAVFMVEIPTRSRKAAN